MAEETTSASAPLHSETQTQNIVGSHDWKYFHVMLNIAEDDLDPYQYRLLGHYIRMVPLIEASLRQPESLRETAEACKMSVDKTRDAREQLVALGYITVKAPDGKEKSRGIGARVTIIDRWKDNVTRSGELVRNLVQRSDEPVRNVVQAPEPVRNIVQAATVFDGQVRNVVQESLGDSRVRAESLQDSKTLDQESFDLEEKKKEREKRLKDSREAWMKAITKLFPHIREDAYAYAGKYISFFQGKSPKEKGGEWDKWKIDNSQIAITAVHVYAFGHWWHTSHSGMTIRKCSTISEYFEEFLALGNLEARLVHAEKLLAKALNLPEIETRKIVDKSLVEAEIAAMQAELAKAVKSGSTRPEIVKYG